MNLGAIDLKLLLAFEALAETRSVSRAAAIVGLRQPAMSAALARLRLLFADELFVRAAGAMQPTPKALRLAPAIVGALAQLRGALSEEVAFVPQTADAQFTIASTDYTSLILLPALVASIRAEAPGIDLRIIGYDKGDIPEMVDRGEIELALGRFPAPLERHIVKRLCVERFVGVARRGHPALIGGKMSADTYADCDHALVSVRRDATGEIDVALERVGLSRRIALVLPHMSALPGVVTSSDLVTALPRRMADLIRHDDIVTFDLPVYVAPWSIEMLWNPQARLDKASAWLRAKVIATAPS